MIQRLFGNIIHFFLGLGYLVHIGRDIRAYRRGRLKAYRSDPPFSLADMQIAIDNNDTISFNLSYEVEEATGNLYNEVTELRNLIDDYDLFSMANRLDTIEEAIDNNPVN